MSFDPIESIAVVPSEEFDEVWMVVKRANGNFIERMVLRMEAWSCGGELEPELQNQIFMDSSVEYEDKNEVSKIVAGIDNVVTITSPNHGYSNGDTVTLENVFGLPQLSGTTWIIGNVTTDTFDLITEVV